MTEGELKRVKQMIDKHVEDAKHLRLVNCDGCGRHKECRRWRDTHYMLCLHCVTNPFWTDAFSTFEASDE